mgnify:CR=1 FL=1
MSLSQKLIDPHTRYLLLAGAVAGVQAIAVPLILALTRDGFSMARHANSQLVLGDWGWVQTASFLVGGLLVIAFGVGIAKALRGNAAGMTAAVCVMIYGLFGWVIVGLNPTDPMFGFPPGARPDYPGYDELSTHAKIHGAAGSIGFLALMIACLAFARYFQAIGERGWALGSVAVALAIAGVGGYLAAYSGDEVAAFDYRPVWGGGFLLWLWLVTMACKLLRSGRAG